MNETKPLWTENPMEFAQNLTDSRRYILLPRIAEMIKENNYASVLDYGCGEGCLLDNITNKDLEIALFDISNVMVELAVKNASGAGFKSVAPYYAAADIQRRNFECVVLSLVLMTIGNDADHTAVLQNCKDALKPGGELIVALTHPCFRPVKFSTHHTSYSLGQEFDYFSEHAPFDVFISNSKAEKPIQFQDFHHSLGYTLSSLQKAGFRLVEFVELKDSSVEESYYDHPASPYLIMRLSAI